MISEKLILAYEGAMDQQVTLSLLSETERQMNLCGAGIQTRRKVFRIMTEMLQNVVRHQGRRPFGRSLKTSHLSRFRLYRSKTGFGILTGNATSASNALKLTRTIQFLNSQDEKGLREIHQAMLRTATLADTGGAGLGLAVVARKSGMKLDFQFDPTFPNHTYFTFHVRVRA